MPPAPMPRFAETFRVFRASGRIGGTDVVTAGMHSAIVPPGAGGKRAGPCFGTGPVPPGSGPAGTATSSGPGRRSAALTAACGPSPR